MILLEAFSQAGLLKADSNLCSFRGSVLQSSQVYQSSYLTSLGLLWLIVRRISSVSAISSSESEMSVSKLRSIALRKSYTKLGFSASYNFKTDISNKNRMPSTDVSESCLVLERSLNFLILRRKFEISPDLSVGIFFSEIPTKSSRFTPPKLL